MHFGPLATFFFTLSTIFEGIQEVPVIGIPFYLFDMLMEVIGGIFLMLGW